MASRMNGVLVWTATLALVATGAGSSALRADPLAMAPAGTDASTEASSIFAPVLRDSAPAASDPDIVATEAQLPPRLRRQVVDYPAGYAPGTIVIDTANTYLYLVLGGGKALRYGVGVGREGFTWSGVETISRMAEWPDWYPPPEMIRRQPYLPRFMAGGPDNPLGARALYLGHSEYRIHGTNDPSTIGHRVSSGCIRLTNEDVADLYRRVRLGATVVVLPAGLRPVKSAAVGPRGATTTAANAAVPGGVAGLY